MKITSVLFCTSAFILAVAAFFDVALHGGDQLNSVVILTLAGTVAVAKYSSENHLRSLFFVAALIPLMLRRSVEVVGSLISPDWQLALVALVLIAGLLHCTDAARRIIET